MSKISRRSFLKTAAAGSVGLGILGTGLLAAAETEEEVVESSEVTQLTETIYSNASWRIKPDPIPESEITAVYEADVCVVGLGHAGATAAMEAYESGVTVIGLEKQLLDSFSTLGGDMGHINSRISESLGGGYGYDPIEWFTNWMINCTNAAEPTLVMKFAQTGGENIDWWYEKANGEVTPTLVFAPANEERPHIQTEVGPYHFYCTAVKMKDTTMVKNCATIVNEADDDSEFMFGYAAAQLLQDESGAVTGVVAEDVENGGYIQVNAKAVVLATGGFGGNEEMRNDLLVDLKYMLQPNDPFSKMGMDRNGDGIRMAYWLGARLEQNPPTMDGRVSWQTSSPAQVPMLAHPQGIHLDYTGRRFYNEYWGPIESRSRPLTTRNRDVFYAVFDDNMTEYMHYVPASHGSTNPTEANLTAMREILDAAYEVKGTGYAHEKSQSVWYAGDTIEEVVEAVGFDEKVKANVLKSIEQWNAIVEAGEDNQFARDSKFLFPIEQGPFYIQVNEGNVLLGNFLVTLGALIVDGDQRVLGEDWMPITGLFATGNTTGGRFGWDYFSPSYGVSVGMAVGLGRECGKSVVEYLNGELV